MINNQASNWIEDELDRECTEEDGDTPHSHLENCNTNEQGRHVSRRQGDQPPGNGGDNDDEDVPQPPLPPSVGAVVAAPEQLPSTAAPDPSAMAQAPPALSQNSEGAAMLGKAAEIEGAVKAPASTFLPPPFPPPQASLPSMSLPPELLS